MSFYERLFVPQGAESNHTAQRVGQCGHEETAENKGTVEFTYANNIIDIIDPG
jgi:hypothetical protein